MRILIYGSTYLTERCCRRILSETDHVLVGYIPNRKEPTVPGGMELQVSDPSIRHDLALSIQFDGKITGEPVAFNLHTGLLPDWGGCDILYHSLRLGAREQGLTFHKITDRWDCGPIIAKTSYPVLPGDDIPSLYQRMVGIAPAFVVSSLALVELIGMDRIQACASAEARIFKRGDVEESDQGMYASTLRRLRERFGRATQQ